MSDKFDPATLPSQWTRLPACAATYETVDVIATCLLEPDHDGPHNDYGNGVVWASDEAPAQPEG